ncbi:MAG: hypothetical protein NTW21_41360 [Verrucomicrobia bacterium]|nr:hypothetical protein [Verrucomicrobiota bacterium]
MAPRFPLFLRRSVADGFLAEVEFAELGAETVHLAAVRVVLGEEALLEKQELVLGTGAVVDDGDEEKNETLGEAVWNFSRLNSDPICMRPRSSATVMRSSEGMTGSLPGSSK